MKEEDSSTEGFAKNEWKGRGTRGDRPAPPYPKHYRPQPEQSPHGRAEVLAGDDDWHRYNPHIVPPLHPIPSLPGGWAAYCPPSPLVEMGFPLHPRQHRDHRRTDWGKKAWWERACGIEGTADGAGGGSRVVIYRQAVFDDVDAMTYRRANTALAETAQAVRYELASDSHDPFDNGVLLRHALFWDSRARLRLASLLDSGAGDWQRDDFTSIDPETAEKSFIFDFKSSYDDNMMATLTEHLHRFLVMGTAYGWYREAGIDSGITETELDSMLDDIKGRFRTGFVFTPLSPFDPKF